MPCIWGKPDRIAVTNKQDGDGLPPEFAPWTYKKSLEIDADDGPRIGADSSEIIEDIERDGFPIWPRARRGPQMLSAKARGRKGGKARAAKLTPERRSEIARKAAAKRWGKST